ncbi:hypothetical protein P8907_20600 [Bacillus atrophaeus]|uniref:hypothetical protein n=1 Tax=Bacillus atrophaeus TaxID=1452 RepID=UPI0022806C66|nr:hypothetical protein [Bacillus atrophaeus]MCY8810637.1 hypothetical protein [Bacillus atrophaeus]MCY8907790.1 hypothetical protein [Bacillus atrophaeus]MEC0837795.1 hypothetical protein [Bacillus atrophaeus]MEC0847696.1 hypothetical protein [Bacillus atrophaeus]MEC0849916.1 hypothetical protein [Bacillus atrophaeus]
MNIVKSATNRMITLSDNNKASLVRRIIEKEKLGYECIKPIESHYYEFVAGCTNKRGCKYRREYIGCTKHYAKMMLHQQK